MKSLIRFEKISKVFGTGELEKQALRDIDIDITEGEFVAITGPSGSGKTTMMNILGCLETPTSGRYLLDGQDVSKLSDDQLADIRKYKIGFVFQSFNLLPRTTVLRNVMLPLVYAGVPDEKRHEMVSRALNAVGFPEDHWGHKQNELSGGQIQRVAIARALVNDPAMILADEPTGNLDSKSGETVLDAFEELNRTSGKTVVIITHEPYVAKRAKRVIRVRDGRIVVNGSDHETADSFSKEFAA